jgi:hypothetical protein
MRFHDGLLLSAMTFVLPLACGGVTPPDRGIPADAAPAELAKAVCSSAYKCCAMSQLMSNDNAGTSEPTCETKTQTSIEQQVAGIEAGEKKGRVLYDGTKVDACVKYLDAAMCADLQMTNHFTGIAACASFLVPMVAIGDACDSDVDCVNGYCDKTGVTSGDGACHALEAEGDSCADAAHCATGLACEATTKTCLAPTPSTSTSGQCFYASGCSTAGDAPTTATALGVLLIVGVCAGVCGARRRRDPRDPAATRFSA